MTPVADAMRPPDTPCGVSASAQKGSGAAVATPDPFCVCADLGGYRPRPTIRSPRRWRSPTQRDRYSSGPPPGQGLGFWILGNENTSGAPVKGAPDVSAKSECRQHHSLSGRTFFPRSCQNFAVATSSVPSQASTSVLMRLNVGRSPRWKTGSKPARRCCW